MKRSIGFVLAIGVWFSGCAASDHATDAKPSGSAGARAAGSAGSTPVAMPAPMPSACDMAIADALDGLPDGLECTGLYSSLQTKTLADGVRAYAPAFPLWSDGSDKERWIDLPAGTKIDSSNMAKWSFPIGTKLFKQFSAGGKRIETRVYQKRDDGSWSHATYLWNSGESAATRVTAGADVALSGGVGTFAGGATYHVPTQRDCDQCHEGQLERVLGFEAVSLGADGATGLTLAALVAEQLLTNPPAQTRLVIGDDGTGVAAPALGWMHTNCGVSCHNARPDSTAYPTKMFLQLDPALLDGRSSKGFDSITTTVGAAAKTQRWLGQTRIVAGAPTRSLLYTLINSRTSKTQQMPPLATVAVDATHVKQVQTWITKIPP
jgi:hypothetical protein